MRKERQRNKNKNERKVYVFKNQPINKNKKNTTNKKNSTSRGWKIKGYNWIDLLLVLLCLLLPLHYKYKTTDILNVSDMHNYHEKKGQNIAKEIYM